MVINQKPSGRSMSVPAGLLVGMAVSAAVTVGAIALLAKLLDAEKMEWQNIGYGIMILLVAASFLGATAAFHRIKRQRLVVCTASGLLYFGLLIAITALFFDGQFEGIWATAGMVLIGSTSAGLLGLRQGGGGKRKPTRRHNR